MSYEQATPDRITKVFIGGLKDLTEDDLRAHFSKYGEFSTERNGKPTTGIEVIKDKETNLPKFAFLHFKNVADCDSCIKANPHFVKNIKLMPRLAVNKDLNYALRQCEKEGQSGKLKVFIGGLPGSADEEKVKAALESHFSNLKVVKVIVKRTKEPERKPRGFGFLTLEDDHEVAKACEIRHFIIEGKQVECKLAPDNQQGGQGGGYGGGRGGGQERGGFRGGYGQSGRGGGRGGASSWQQDSYGSSAGYGAGYDSWPGGNESYDNGSDYYAQDTSYTGYSQNGGNGYNTGYNYDSTYGQSTASDYYGSGDGYGQSQGGYGAARGGGRGRGGASSYSSGRGAARGAGGRGGARGGGRGAPRHHPYQQQSY